MPLALRDEVRHIRGGDVGVREAATIVDLDERFGPCHPARAVADDLDARVGKGGRHRVATGRHRRGVERNVGFHAPISLERSH